VIVHGVPRWPASLALLTCVALYVVLPNRLVIGPRWLIPALIVLLLVPLSTRRHRHPDESPRVRHLTLTLITLVTLANVTSMVFLVQRLLDTSVSQGRALIYSAVSVWLTNIIIYGVWFWEIDRGGPTRRAAASTTVFDLQFPQMENPTLAPDDWEPRFTDYLYQRVHGLLRHDRRGGGTGGQHPQVTSRDRRHPRPARAAHAPISRESHTDARLSPSWPRSK